MGDPAQIVRDILDRTRDASVAFLQQLVRLQPEGEAAIQAHVAAALAAAGCGVERLDYHPAEVELRGEFAGARAMAGEQRSSIVARMPGAGGGRSLIFFAHPDGEPVGGLDRWRRDPFAGVIDGGRLYGWGVSDDLAGVATFVQAVRALHAGGLRPAGDVVLASTPSKRHARGVHAVLQNGWGADAAVYLHPAESGAGMREIKAFASGLLEFRVLVRGRPPQTSEPSHTAFAHVAVNPLDKAWIVHRALTALGERRAARIRHPALDEAVGRSTSLLVATMQCGEGERVGRVAPSCVLGCSLAFPPPETLDAVRQEVVAAIEEAACADPWLRETPPLVEFVSGVVGAETPPAHPLYRATADAIVAVTGRQPYVNVMHTSSDIRVPIVQKGIPTVGLGPLGGDLSQNGCHDEWVDVEDYLRGVKVAASIVLGWCGASATPAG